MNAERHYHAIVWIDHRDARIFYFGKTDAEEIVIHPHHPVRHIHHKAGSVGAGHTETEVSYYRDVTEALEDAGAVLIVGPSGAKTELESHIRKFDAGLSKRIAGVLPMDHANDGEILAFARHHFQGADLMRA